MIHPGHTCNYFEIPPKNHCNLGTAWNCRMQSKSAMITNETTKIWAPKRTHTHTHPKKKKLIRYLQSHEKAATTFRFNCIIENKGRRRSSSNLFIFFFFFFFHILGWQWWSSLGRRACCQCHAHVFAPPQHNQLHHHQEICNNGEILKICNYGQNVENLRQWGNLENLWTTMSEVLYKFCFSPQNVPNPRQKHQYKTINIKS